MLRFFLTTIMIILTINIVNAKEVTPKLVKDHINTFKKKLPMQLDKYMVLNDVKLNKKSVNFFYKFTHNMNKEELIKTQFVMDEEICRKDSYGYKMIKHNYIFNSIYINKYNQQIATIPTKKQDCIILHTQIKYKNFIQDLTKEEFKEFNPMIQPFSNIYNDRLRGITK